MSKKIWRVKLTEKQRGIIILMAERFEGKRTEFQRMDRAIDVIDSDYSISDQMTAIQGGISIPLEKLDTKVEVFEFPNEPFKTLKNFLKEQGVNYSRRRDTFGRIFVKEILIAFDAAEEVEESDASGS